MRKYFKNKTVSTFKKENNNIILIRQSTERQPGGHRFTPSRLQDPKVLPVRHQRATSIAAGGQGGGRRGRDVPSIPHLQPPSNYSTKPNVQDLNLMFFEDMILFPNQSH